MKKIWFSSDQHFGHANVIRFCNRPFATVQEMNEQLIRYHNETVGPEDEYWCVGDFSLALGWVDAIGSRIIAGTKNLVSGNHDWTHRKHTTKPQKIRRARERCEAAGFIVKNDEEVITHSGKIIKVCHLPYWEDALPGQEYEARFKELRPIPGEEDFLICGHVHQVWKIKRHPSSGKIMYNVGVDVHNYRPVLIDDILQQVEDFHKHL